MVFIEGISSWNLLSYKDDALKTCFLIFRIALSVTFLMTKIMGLILAYRYYQTMNEIYKFSLEGVLPSEISKRREKCMLTLLVVTMAGIVAIYMTFCTFFSLRHDLEHLFIVTKVS